MTEDERLRCADAYLDGVIDSLRRGTHFRPRDVFDPWFAFEFGNDSLTGAAFLTGGSRPHTFNNPCPWQHWRTLRHPHFWVTTSADDVLARAQARDRSVRKDERDETNPDLRLVVEHAVPLARIVRELRRDHSLWHRTRLREFLIHHFRRGVLTKSEDMRLNATKIEGVSLSDDMPPDWIVGGDPFARYSALHPALVRAAHCASAEARSAVPVRSISEEESPRPDPSTNIKLVLKAAVFAADRHRMQRRKDADASPYINHPLALAHILSSEAGITDSTVLAAALLHDTVEDTETSLEELTREFGAEVAGIVAEVTDDKTLPKEERKRLQVSKASGKSNGAKLVKLADKISNLRDIAATPPADWSIERRLAYFSWAKKVVEGLRGSNAHLEAIFDEIYEGGMQSLQQLLYGSTAEHSIPERLRQAVESDLVSRIAEMGTGRPEGADEALAVIRGLPQIDRNVELQITWSANDGPPEGVELRLTSRRLELTVSDEDGSQEIYCCDAGCDPDFERDRLVAWLTHFRSLGAPEVAIRVWS